MTVWRGPKPGLARFSRQWRVLVSAFVVTAMLALTACSPDEPEPTGTPTVTPTVTPTPTPSRTSAPERPAEMDRDDLEGAKAAAQYFLELHPYAYNTGDLEAWKAMSHPECIFCAGVVENVEKLHGEGGYEVGGDLVFESVDAFEPVEGNEFHGVDAVLQQGSSAVHDAAGALVRETQPGRYLMLMALSLQDDGWAVREVTPEELE